MTRKEILNTAEKYVCEDRNESYSEPEDSFSNIANYWNDHLFGKYGFEGIMPEDVGIMMALLKIARMASRTKDDNFIDAAGYIACAGEIATQDQKDAKSEIEKFWYDVKERCGREQI